MNTARTFSTTASLLSRATSHSVSSHTSHSVGDQSQGNRAQSQKQSSDAPVSLVCSAIDDALEGERRKFVPSSHVELVLELHPGKEKRRALVLPTSRTYG